MNKRVWFQLAAAIVGGSALASTAFAASALGWVGAASPPMSPPMSPPTSAQLTIKEQGQLLDRGATAKLTATITCGPGSPTSRDLFIDLAQPGHRRIAFGFGHNSQFVCDGTPHQTDVLVHAEGLPFQARPFQFNDAIALGRLEVTFPQGFHQHAAAAQTVTLIANAGSG